MATGRLLNNLNASANSNERVTGSTQAGSVTVTSTSLSKRKKATFSIDTFKAEIYERGLARQNRFEVLIQKPAGLTVTPEGDARFISMMAESTNFPPLNISVQSQKIFGPSYQRAKSSEYGGEGITINFYVDANMGVKMFFDDWMQFIVKRSSFYVEYPKKYISPRIEICQLNEKDEIVYQNYLWEAFPRAMNIMELNHVPNANTHRLSVTFAYRYWTTDLSDYAEDKFPDQYVVSSRNLSTQPRETIDANTRKENSMPAVDPLGNPLGYRLE
jgi:hypothetical protein